MYLSIGDGDRLELSTNPRCRKRWHRVDHKSIKIAIKRKSRKHLIQILTCLYRTEDTCTTLVQVGQKRIPQFLQ